MEDRFDSNWNDLFSEQAMAGVKEAEDQDMDLLPRGRYGILFEKVETRVSKTSGIPYPHFQIRVEKGVKGTVNRVIFDDFFFSLPPANDPSFKERAEGLRSTLLRIKNHMGNERLAPADPKSKEAIEAWAKQLEGKRAVVRVMIAKARTDEATGAEYPAKNRLIWNSVAGYQSDVIDAKTGQRTGKTYEALLNEEIAAADSKGPASAKAATTAGSAFGRPQPRG